MDQNETLLFFYGGSKPSGPPFNLKLLESCPTKPDLFAYKRGCWEKNRVQMFATRSNTGIFFVSLRTLVYLVTFLGFSLPILGQHRLEPDQLPSETAPGAHGGYARVPPHIHPGSENTSSLILAPATTLESVPTFSGGYFAHGFNASNAPQFSWHYQMIGTEPEAAVTTNISAPIIPVSLDLRNADGSPRFVNGHRLFSDATRYVKEVLASPLFMNAHYSSSQRATQFVDAVQRAEFYNRAANRPWHTMLKPSVKTARVMVLRAGTYQFSLHKDGTCCAFVLVDFNTFYSKLLPTSSTDRKSPVGAAELAGDIHTRDISTFLFPNTFLFSDPNVNFFFVGFHTFDERPASVSNGFHKERFVLNFSSWVTPFIFFGDNFEDITAISHEIAETVNDPFVAADGVHGITPWWMAPNGNCQDLLETGDVVEDLPNATFPMRMNGVIYHPQNEALLPWFERQKPSRAIHGAYSYPDERLLLTLSPPELANCQ